MVNGTCKLDIIPSAIVALQFMAADLDKEPAMLVEEIEQLRLLCDELRSEITKSSDLPKFLKEWLLDLIRLMRDAIDRYKIRGSRGLRRQLNEMVGSLYGHEALAEETKKKDPSLWSKIMAGFDKMVKMADFSEKAQKCLPYLKDAFDKIAS